MGNLLNGVSSESENVGARWPLRNSLADAQSLKPSPAFNNGACSLGIANAPSATSGVSFSSSRRFMARNLRLSVCEFIQLHLSPTLILDRIQEWQSSYTNPVSRRGACCGRCQSVFPHFRAIDIAPRFRDHITCSRSVRLRLMLDAAWNA